MVDKGSRFADFVIFRPNTYTLTQQSLPPLWAAIIYCKLTFSFSGTKLYGKIVKGFKQGYKIICQLVKIQRISTYY